ncbi:lutropin-choriogonadotropic hormone receptor isoform X3 [Cephus cinctus]|uniref:Lutropin-choriogonadotropic hormone receptor isoform X3 n=1 Tax=Cephus cinctus TaxID=211228 RepID=A0AAJ7W0L1_CEPCN|nr:lutropin-choriogonadotropic hormone receptor isoform X3 [Cephus cinctus]
MKAIEYIPLGLLLLMHFASSQLDSSPSPVNETESQLDPFDLTFVPISGLECNCIQHQHETDCRCRGDSLYSIPTNLTDLTILTIAEAGIKIIERGSLNSYSKTLRDLNLINVPNLRTLESGVFRNTIKLRSIYIYRAPNLTYIEDDVFNVYLPQLRILRIMGTGLLAVPYLGSLRTDNILHVVDLENNLIQNIGTASIKVKAEQLSLKGNVALRNIHTDAFVGLKSLRNLDLSETSIVVLPIKGLQDLDTLIMKDTKSLKVFPSIYNFEYIKEAHLTYPYHCCAFKFPAKHDPAEHRKHEEFILQINKYCAPRRRRRRDDWWQLSFNNSNSYLDEEGHFHDMVKSTDTKISIMCGNITRDYKDVNCEPIPDAFNPCEDLMGNWALRIAVWLVAVLAIVGNLAVLIVLVSSRFRMTVPKFLMCNLALADLCMGVYLILIASTDARSIGAYFNYAIDWQSGLGCQVAGYLTVFSSELSIFTLTVITSERWYTITYAIHLNRRLKLKTAARIMAVGWIYASAMAALPLIGISGYAKTSICLPLENRDTTDLLYLITLLVFNGLAFWVIVACYGRMYCSIRGGQEVVMPMTRSDMTVAKRMALLVFTDFACWAPIAFFGLTALSGYPLIDVTQTKILLVFFYPLNSCANPYLYALLTHQYRRDMFILLSRYGMCVDRAAKYKGAIGGIPTAAGIRVTNQIKRNTPNNHRGSVLTTVTSVDVSTHNNNVARMNSLGAVQELHLVNIRPNGAVPLSRENSAGRTKYCSTAN